MRGMRGMCAIVALVVFIPGLILAGDIWLGMAFNSGDWRYYSLLDTFYCRRLGVINNPTAIEIAHAEMLNRDFSVITYPLIFK